MTRLSSGSNDSEQSVSVYTEALLEQTAERLQDLVTIIARSEQARADANQQLAEMNGKLGILADQMRAEQQVLLRLAENQRELTPVIRHLGDAVARLGTLEGAQNSVLDDATRAHIRSIDSLLGRLTHSVEAGRDETIREIRAEIKLLARTVAGRDPARDSAA